MQTISSSPISSGLPTSEKTSPKTVELVSNVTIDVRDVDGHLVSRQKRHNLVVNNGLDILRDLLGGSLNEEPTDIAVGTNNTTPTSTDTTLLAEVFRNQITRRLDSAQKLTFQLFISTSQANGNTLVEAGLIRVKNSADRLFARIIFGPIVKTVSVSVTITWEVTFSAA